MKITSDFAELYGAFAGDGWISRGNAGMTLFISGNPANEKEYYFHRIGPLFKKTVGLEVFLRDFLYWGTFGVMVCRQEIIRKFISVGAPVGKKANIIKVPGFAQSDTRLFISFACGLFDTDGCIDFRKSYNQNASIWQKKNKHRPRVMFSTVSPALAHRLQQELRKIGLPFAMRIVKPTKRNNNPCYKLELEGKNRAKEFFERIKPQNPKHLVKFNQWLKQGFYTLP